MNKSFVLVREGGQQFQIDPRVLVYELYVVPKKSRVLAFRLYLLKFPCDIDKAFITWSKSDTPAN